MIHLLILAAAAICVACCSIASFVCFLCYVCYALITMCCSSERPTTPRNPLEYRRINAPMPLPKTRERALTLISDMPEQRQRIYEQAQSNFFAKLPAELRSLIYTEILGGNVLHIVKREKRLGHLRCKVNRLQDERVLGCWGINFRTTPWTGKYVYRSPTDGDLMPMLKSCKRV